MFQSEMRIKTEQFDGPLGLMLLLIQQNEMDVNDLDITIVTKQYLEYIQRMKDINFDLAGEYLYMAATLVLLKSKACLDDGDLNKNLDEEGLSELIAIQSREELIRRLVELQRFQRLGLGLWELPRLGQEVFVRPKVSRKSIADTILTPLNLSELTQVMLDFMSKEARKYKVVKRDKITIKEKLVYLRSLLKVGGTQIFNELLYQNSGDNRLSDVIITFISLLELARLKKIQVYQNEDKSDIYVNVLEDLDSFNMDMVDDYVSQAEQLDPEAISIPMSATMPINENPISPGIETLK